MSTLDAPGSKLQAVSGILYVRAGLKPFAKHVRQAGSFPAFLAEHFGYEELMAPFFIRARPFWERPVRKPQTNSGPAGRLVFEAADAIASRHPSHRFAGFGARVEDVLRQHDETTSCFYPIAELARRHDFSMLLLGCVEQSPGFSTVHAVQHSLGLTQKHLDRFLIRWDVEREGRWRSMLPRESPGCSKSFGKFYPAYEKDNNLVRGTLCGAEYLFVPSARKAIEAEREILSVNPRFVDCGRPFCLTCRFRLY